MNNYYTFNIKVSSEELTKLVNKVLDALNGDYERLIGGVKVITIKLADASDDHRWKYFLDYYPDDNRITVTMKMGGKQPGKYSIFRISSVINEVEPLEKLLERIVKIYLLFNELRMKLDKGGDENLI